MDNKALKTAWLVPSKSMAIAIIGVMLLSCASSANKAEVNDDEYACADTCDYRTKIRTAILEGDASHFASMSRYPIYREYPLHDICDSASMVKYFPYMADDSLKRVFEDSTPDDWIEIGWRGTSLYDCSYIWCDEGVVYCIPYQSERELCMLDSLCKADMASLPDDLVSGWLPETCLIDSVGTVYRIDKKILSSQEEDSRPCRLLIYPKGQKRYKTAPSKLLYGTLVYQGSSSSPEYTFNDSDGTTWLYFNFWYEDYHYMCVDRPGCESEEIDIKKYYWLD